MATIGQEENAELDRRYDELYANYGKALEPEHNGEFLAISPRGETLLAPTFDEVTAQGVERFGRGIFVYKVGERAALKWR
jgi:hypothetical protein